MRIVRSEATSLAKLPPMPNIVPIEQIGMAILAERHNKCLTCGTPWEPWDINESRMGASKISVSPIDGISSPRRIGGSSLGSNSPVSRKSPIGVRRPSFSRRTKRGGWRTSPSCRNC